MKPVSYWDMELDGKKVTIDLLMPGELKKLKNGTVLYSINGKRVVKGMLPHSEK